MSETVSLHQLNWIPKIMVQVCYFRHLNWFLSSVTIDGRGEHDKKRTTFLCSNSMLAYDRYVKCSLVNFFV